MTVYVDDMRARFGRMIMCHMLADTSEELLAMADRIGVQRKWLQYPGTEKEHFDIALSKRARAIAAGAREIEWRDYPLLVRKKMGQLGWTETYEASVRERMLNRPERAIYCMCCASLIPMQWDGSQMACLSTGRRTRFPEAFAEQYRHIRARTTGLLI